MGTRLTAMSKTQPLLIVSTSVDEILHKIQIKMVFLVYEFSWVFFYEFLKFLAECEQ